MKTILITKAHIEKPKMDLEYYLLQKGERYGIEIREKQGESAASFIPDTFENVRALLWGLAKYTVTPVALNDVVDDYLKEKLL